MIREIYVDNFRCLSNFKTGVGQFQLWLGENGSGKTTVIDALRTIQSLLSGQSAAQLVGTKSLTRWDKRAEQTFRLVLDIDQDLYEYELVVEQGRTPGETRIKRERLAWRQMPFFHFDGQEAHLFRIDSKGAVVEGVKFPADWSRSAIPGIAARPDNHPLIRFREETRKWLIVQPIPALMGQIAETEDRSLSPHADNFANWYRHLLQENPGITYKAKEALADVLPGFEGLSLKESGDARRLMVSFKIAGKDEAFEFQDLSDGQRQLIVLHVILESLRQGIFSALLIDEPDNFVSLREVQPWLNELREVCDSGNVQAVVISHHPEIINAMAHGAELWFSRKEGAQVVTAPFPTIPGLTPAETMARGWES